MLEGIRNGDREKVTKAFEMGAEIDARVKSCRPPPRTHPDSFSSKSWCVENKIMSHDLSPGKKQYGAIDPWPEEWFKYGGKKFKAEGGLTNHCNKNMHPVPGDTALHLCARSGQRTLLAVLLTFGANTSVENINGDRPIDILPENSGLEVLFG